MAIEIKSPTFPESVADGTVANWVKKEGDQVNQDEIIAEIETDKVVLEVVAPTNGVLTKILKKKVILLIVPKLLVSLMIRNKLNFKIKKK